MTPPVVLTVAGSDSSGAAGLQADLPTFAAHGVHGMSAITMVTSQSSAGVHRVSLVPVDQLEAQLEAAFDDGPVAAVKTGLVLSADAVEAIAALLAGIEHGQLVVDPVLVDSHGEPLGEPDLIAGYRAHLLSHATALTPNLREAELLLGRTLDGVDDVVAAAEDLLALGAPLVVVTGGRLGQDLAVDVVMRGAEVEIIERPRIITRNTRGSGCTFSAALTARLALGDDPVSAARGAGHFAWTAVSGAQQWHLGDGRGPVSHLTGWGKWDSQLRPIT
ncbi:MAG: bifunctional hydroxymethylpyrimidine kinase/phosphomethylpyrimidine kinase [Acidimicrobiia bacterium]|nr:bifunctional hydroxymethylpyrimidine kinase/phosphomethylpyrimidine kinase [Acidimicrobiia bacterium]